MSARKHVKFAVIRSNENQKCPFGLPIPFGCNSAGDVIEQMAPTDCSEEDESHIRQINRILLSAVLSSGQTEPKRCRYADAVHDDKVNCVYGDGDDAGFNVKTTPYYNDMFNERGPYGLLTYPIGHYGDYGLARNLYYGVFSLQGKLDIEERKKIASEIYHDRFKDGDKKA